MTKNRTPTPVYLDPGMHSGLEVKGLKMVVSTRPNYTEHILHKAGGSLIDPPLTIFDKEDITSYVN